MDILMKSLDPFWKIVKQMFAPNATLR
jgi:hypothetical protein